MKSSLLASISLACVLFAQDAARAADIELQDSMATYVSVFAAKNFPTDVHGISVGATTSYSTTVQLQSGSLAGGSVGIHVTDTIRSEVELSVARAEGKHIQSVDEFGAIALDGSLVKQQVNTMFLFANTWFDWKTDSAFTPYAGGGVGLGWIDSHFDGVLGDSEGVNLALQVGGGVTYAFSDHLSLDVGYRYKTVLDATLPYTNGSDAFFKKADFGSHNFQLGFSYSL